MDPWKILPDEQVRYDQQFAQLNPADGFLSGQQSRDFFFKSNLSPPILAKIWELSDLNRDGRLDKKEFSIAMHLIRKKIQGLELPEKLPTSMVTSPLTSSGGVGGLGGMSGMGGMGGVGGAWGNLPDLLQQRPTASPPSVLGSMPGNLGGVSGTMGDLQTLNQGFPQQQQQQQSFTMPGMGTLPHGSEQRSRTGSSIGPGVVPTGEWAVPHGTKLKFNKMFHDLDKSRTGFLNGGQARTILMQSGLPTPSLAQIWALADIDKDGRLSSEEFVLAMHLAEMGRQKEPIPTVLPSELIPPSFRRPRGMSAHVQIPLGGSGGGGGGGGASAMDGAAGGPASQEVFDMTPASFEDKRKENFDKGNAELERRRQAIQEMQRQEREEREKREREEFERREKLRFEQEKKRQAELELNLIRQREIEERKEEERRKFFEQEEILRLENEKQRKIEKQRKKRFHLLNERTKEYEILQNYRMNNSTFQLNHFDSDTKRFDFIHLVEETRNQVRERKEIIDKMRIFRDEILEEITQNNNEENNLSVELQKAKGERAVLEGRMSVSSSAPSGDTPQTLTFEVQRRQDALAELQNKLTEAETTTSSLQKTIEERNSRIQAFSELFQPLYESHIRLLHDFQNKQTTLIQTAQKTGQKTSRKVSITEIQSTNLYPSLQTAATSGSYGFSHDVTATSQNGFNPMTSQDGFNGGGEAWGDNGFEAPDDVWGEESPFNDPSAGSLSTAEPTELTESIESIESSQRRASEVIRTPSIKHEHVSFDNGFKETKFRRFRALYAYVAGNEDELSFQAGDVISVPLTHDGEPGWLPGELAGKTGWLPENHVQLLPEAADLPKEKPVPKSRGSSVQSDTPAHDGASGEPLAGNVRAKAIHPWHAKKDTHLTFAKGDILLLKKQADNWFFGEKDSGQSGWFPAQCVQLLTDTPTAGTDQQFPVTGDPKKTYHSHSSVDSHNSSATDVESFFLSVFDYNSEVEGDLAFRAGEIIRVIQKNGEWWTGVIDSRTGIFPSNYVKEYNDSPQLPSPASLGKAMAQTNTEDLSKKKPEIAVAVAAYVAGGPEQISFSKGDMILVKKKTETGWWEGELQAKGKQRQIGWFPAAYIKSMTPQTPADGTVPTTSKSRAGSIASHTSDGALPAGSKVLAMYDYAALNPDELSFKKNDTIIIVSKEDENWWKGVLNGKEGILPSNYVQILN